MGFGKVSVRTESDYAVTPLSLTNLAIVDDHLVEFIGTEVEQEAEEGEDQSQHAEEEDCL